MSHLVFLEKVFGKIVLAGEHAVLRGGAALVIPSLDHEMNLEWSWTENERESSESFGSLYTLILKAKKWILENKESIEKEGKNKKNLFPKLNSLKSTIPEQAGLGSSAALCVLFSKMMLGKVSIEKVIQLGTELENHFHGKSSGMDVTAVAYGRPIFIQSLLAENREIVLLDLPKEFKFKLFDTGIRSQTKECIEKVNALWSEDAFLKMQESVQCGVEAFKSRNILRMRESMNLSLSLYEKWGLVPKEVERQIIKLKSENKISTIRLTGSGLGGFLVGLE